MKQGVFRIVFFVNFIQTPFIWKGFEGISEFKRASQLANLLADFDLSRTTDEEILPKVTAAKIATFNGEAMISAYKAYRRKHGINHPDMIEVSDMSIDQFDGKSWWIVSENCDTIEYEFGEMDAFDTNYPV